MPYNLRELLIYRPAVSKRKGVVGKPGTKMPVIPAKRESVPSKINIGFNKNIFLCVVPCEFPDNMKF